MDKLSISPIDYIGLSNILSIFAYGFEYRCYMMKKDMKAYRLVLLSALVMMCGGGMKLSAQEPVTESKLLPQTSSAGSDVPLQNPNTDKDVKSLNSIDRLLPYTVSPAMPTFSFPLDSVRMGQVRIWKNNNGPGNPLMIDFHDVGTLSSWRGGYLYGGSDRNTMVGLMVMQDARMGVVQRYGNFTLAAGLSANRYSMPYELRTRYGINGSLAYRFDENVSLTMFGNYFHRPFYSSMAAIPYIGTSAYGGYVSLTSGNIGLDLGVQQQYDVFSRQWRTVPIVTPKFNIGKMRVELPVGELVGRTLQEVFNRHEQRGPMIMPPMHH